MAKPSLWRRFTNAVSKTILSIGQGLPRRRPPPQEPLPPPRPPQRPPSREPIPPAPSAVPTAPLPPTPQEVETVGPPGGYPPPDEGIMRPGGPLFPTEEQVPPWFGNEVPLEDDYGNPIGAGFTVDDWLHEALRTKEELLEEYGIDNLDIMYKLQEMGLIDEQDWEDWRDQYELLYG
jgi:hypothetical protein